MKLKFNKQTEKNNIGQKLEDHQTRVIHHLYIITLTSKGVKKELAEQKQNQKKEI